MSSGPEIKRLGLNVMIRIMVQTLSLYNLFFGQKTSKT